MALLQEVKKITDSLNLQVSEHQLKQFEQYLLLLEKWNKTFNLTAITKRDEMLEKHLLDSLAIAEHLQGESFLDVGTGAGLPGIPLAILFPEKQFSLLDSNSKKTRFLQQVKAQLKLANVTIYHSRVEKLEVEQGFDGILSRAFATLKDMLEGSEHLCASTGHFFAMKGLYPEVELQEITKNYKVQEIRCPGLHSERHLVIISNS